MVRKKGMRAKAHQDWDLAAAPGTAIYAITYGEAEAMPEDANGWGKWVRLQFLHDGAVYYAFYCYLGSIAFTGGCSAAEGMILGATGMTGNARNLGTAEAHLHFGISASPTPRGTGSATHVVDYIDPGEVLGYEVYSLRR